MHSAFSQRDVRLEFGAVYRVGRFVCNLRLVMGRIVCA
jgi:hypothetical protein